MRELDTSLARVRNAWIAGRPGLEGAPLEWRDAIGHDELALIALVGHAGDVLTQRKPSFALVDRPLLPQLNAPFVPEPLRARFLRLLVRPKNQASLEQHLIAFTTARGFAAHPGDWMPDAKDDWAPDLYAPWLDWIRADTRTAAPSDEINIENYELWSWTERRKALAELRARDPVAALAIIAAKAGIEPAERRVRLIELMQVRLSEADAEFLESLGKDRSDRVRALSHGFLARLGRTGDTTTLAIELAEMIALEKTGLINRRMRLKLPALKTNAQLLRRRELMKMVGLGALAGALDATEPQLVESAPDCAPEDMHAFTTMVAETGSDAAVQALLTNLISGGETPLIFLLPLAGRLTATERAALLPALMRLDAQFFETTLAIAGGGLGGSSLSALSASPSYGAIQANVEAAAGPDDNIRRNAMATLEHVLPRAGLLLDNTGAKALLAHITRWGLSPAEPVLDMLHFNAALTPETTP